MSRTKPYTTQLKDIAREIVTTAAQNDVSVDTVLRAVKEQMDDVLNKITSEDK